MKPDVLEQNVRRLLRQAYVPALPAPHFRDRLEALVLGEVARRARRARAGRARPWPRLLVAAAAALVLAFLGWRSLRPDAAPTRADLLARGEVALGLPDGSWRAASAEERVQGVLFVPPALVAATPAEAELELRLEAGTLHLAARSEVALAQGPRGLAATLRAGSAAFSSGDRRLELVPGETLDLAGLADLPEESVEPLASRTAPAGREAAPVESAPSTPATAPSASERVLAGQVVVAADGQPVPAFTLALLEERRGNETPPPEQRAFSAADGRFRWVDPPAGKQRVFVHAPGYALCALGEFELSGECPELRAALEPGHVVRGSVLDDAGNPIPGALVLSEQDTPTDGLMLDNSEHIYWLPIQARSGPDGRFELAHLTAGMRTLRASALGYSTAWLDGLSVPAKAGAELEELVFTLGPGGTIAGRVTRADGGPWAEATLVCVTMDQVQRARTNFGIAHTDADGRYRFEHVPATTMIVVLLRSDEQPDVRPVQVVEDETATANFDSERRGIRLHGRVLDRAGQPVALRNIGLFDAETASWNQDWVASSTRADGSYVFDGVQPGRYQLLLIDDMGRGLHGVDELELAAGTPDVEHDVHVPGGRLAVTVRKAEDGSEVGFSALIVVRVEPDGRGGQREFFAAYGPTDEHGRYTFDDMLPGSYRIVAYPSQAGLGFVQSEVTQLDADKPVELELLHEPGGQVAVVVRASDGHALEGAAVVFHDESGVEHLFSRVPLTDAAGRYQAFGLRPGLYRVEAHLEGHQGTPVTFRYELGRELEIPIVLAPR